MARATPDRLGAPLERAARWLFPREPEDDPRGVRRAWLLGLYTVRRFWSVDRCSGLAASLALETLLSVVPLTGVVLFFIRRLDPQWGQEFLARIARTLVPEAERADDLAARIVELGDNVTIDALGPWGFLAVIVLAYVLFSTLERVFAEIWRVAKRRNLVAKFTMFYTLASLAPVVLFYSLAQPVLGEVTDVLLVTPLLSTGIGLVLLNRLMPNTPVRWSAAAAGGLLSAAAFELSKWAFGRYLSLVALHTYEGVYGALAVLPVFVVWSYVTWLIVLLGAELSFVLHHVNSVAREGYVHARSRDQTRLQASPGRAAARLMLAVCDNYVHRKLGTTAEQLDRRFELGLSRVVGLCARLEEAGFLVPLEGDRGFVPARPPAEIALRSVLEMFDAGDLSRARDDALAGLYDELDRRQVELVGDATFQDLVDREQGPRDANLTAGSG